MDDLGADLEHGPRPRIDAPAVTTERIGLYALTQHVEQPDGRAIVLRTDSFGDAPSRERATLGPFGRFPIRDGNSALLFACRARSGPAR